MVKTRKADYEGVVNRIRESFFGFEYKFIPKSALEATAEEREREFDQMWDAGGFAFWLANYQDMFFSQEANELCADYIKRKIRKTVKDPAVAEKLIPKGYPYGTKRQPLDTNYYETFNKDNVLLVDAGSGGPIEEIRPGDVVWFEPNEKHWHGAGPTVAMTHIAIQEALNGKVVDWMEKVSDEQYGGKVS